MDAAFLLTIGSFLPTVELVYLQLTILALLLTVGAFVLTALAFYLQLEFFCLQWESASNKGLEGLQAKKLNCKQNNSNCKWKTSPLKIFSKLKEKLWTKATLLWHPYIFLPTEAASALCCHDVSKRASCMPRASNDRRRTNVQQLTCNIDLSNLFLLSFLLFCSPWAQTLCFEGEVPGENSEKVWKSAKKC